MSLLQRYSALKLNAITARSKRDSLSSNLSLNSEALTLANSRLEEVNNTRRNLIGSIDIMKQLIDLLSHEQINQLQELLSYGLKTIFTDRDYSAEIQISESRNVKQATFFLVETLSDGSTIRSEFKDAIGGGILATVGLIIQVYYIVYYQQRPIIFMDEALSQISSQYLPNVLAFINQLAVDKQFKFVLISHDERFMEYGVRVYSVNNGRVTSLRQPASP
jgi:ABC-type dipeptide/oligopeptide/nickel transport system ATPase subunit